MRYQRDLFHEGQTYHVYNKAVGNELLFNAKSDYTFFLGRFAKYIFPFVDVYAYCLLPNHFHFLMKVREPDFNHIKKENTKIASAFLNNDIPINKFLENQLSRMLSGYTLSVNKRSARMGQLFKQGTKRVLIKSELKILQLLCYVHHNPIHHGITNNYKKWQFCSYNAYINEVNTQIAKNEMLEFLGGKEEFYRVHDEFKKNYHRS